MRVTARGETDGGNIIMFWPDNMPEDADVRIKSEVDGGFSLVEELHRDGKLIWFPCDGDISCDVTVYINEPVPETLTRFCHAEPEWANLNDYPRLLVKGDGVFGGMEYLFKNDRSPLERHAGMIETIVIPDGVYHGKVYQTRVPREWQKSWLDERVGRRIRKASNAASRLIIAGFYALLAGVVLMCFFSWGGRLILLAMLAGIVIAMKLLSRSSASRIVEEAMLEYRKEFPYYVVHLTPYSGDDASIE